MEITASGSSPALKRAGRLVSVAMRKDPAAVPLAAAIRGSCDSREGPAAQTAAR
jgi:hypothetical protein